MTPKAYLVHKIRNRARIRVPGKRGSAEYFDRLEKELVKLRGIDEVRANPVTASLLIFHNEARGEKLWEQLIRSAKVRKLFLLTKEERRTLTKLPTMSPPDLTRALATASGVFGMIQLFRGQWLPPAWTLLSDAAVILTAEEKISRKARMRKLGSRFRKKRAA